MNKSFLLILSLALTIACGKKEESAEDKSATEGATTIIKNPVKLMLYRVNCGAEWR